jgi:hypothetical protein
MEERVSGMRIHKPNANNSSNKREYTTQEQQPSPNSHDTRKGSQLEW